MFTGQASNAAARGLGEQVIGSLEENLGLLQRSLEAGKISRTEVFLLRREFVESQREYLDALSQALRARVQLDLAAGRIDGYISDIPAVEYYIKDKPQYRVAGRIPTGERYSFMFAKTFADAAKVNDALTALKKEGFIAKTHQKWFGTMPPADSATVKVLDMPK